MKSVPISQVFKNAEIGAKAATASESVTARKIDKVSFRYVGAVAQRNAPPKTQVWRKKANNPTRITGRVTPIGKNRRQTGDRTGEASDLGYAVNSVV